MNIHTVVGKRKINRRTIRREESPVQNKMNERERRRRRSHT